MERQGQQSSNGQDQATERTTRGSDEPTTIYRPFPVDALPNPIGGFVADGAKAIGCDPSFLALPLLASFAAAIGTSRVLILKRGWAVPSILWVAIVGESGTSKTPAFRLAMKPIRARQGVALKEHNETIQDQEAELARFERDLALWKRSKDDSDPPEKPEQPQAARYIVSDTTVEALAPILQANPRGLLLARDELAGWLGSFDRYSNGKGGDGSHWLSMYNGENIVVDRKTGEPKTLFVPRAALSICGGIQPGILNRALGIEHRESGLAARLLVTCPPRLVKRWTEQDIDPAAEQALTRLVDRLFELQPEGDDPKPIGMAPDAKRVWLNFYDKHAQEQAELSGKLSAAWSKLEETPARPELVERLRVSKTELLDILRGGDGDETPRTPGETAVVSPAVPQDTSDAAERLETIATDGQRNWQRSDLAGCETIDPPEPCPDCGGIVVWQDMAGGLHCPGCDAAPGHGERLRKLATRLRGRHIPDRNRRIMIDS